MSNIDFDVNDEYGGTITNPTALEVNWGEPSHTMILVDGFEIHFTDNFKYPNRWHRLWHRIFFGFRYRLEE